MNYMQGPWQVRDSTLRGNIPLIVMRALLLLFPPLSQVKEPICDLNLTLYMFGSLARGLHRSSQISAGTVQTSVVHSDV